MKWKDGGRERARSCAPRETAGGLAQLVEGVLRARRPDQVLPQALRKEVERSQPSRGGPAWGCGKGRRQRGRVSRGINAYLIEFYNWRIEGKPSHLNTG